MSNNDFLATLLAGVGHVPTAAEIAADTHARAIARADHCAAVLDRTIADYGYGRRSDTAAAHLTEARALLAA